MRSALLLLSRVSFVGGLLLRLETTKMDELINEMIAAFTEMSSIETGIVAAAVAALALFIIL
jgi:hypothetical protein